MPWRGPICSSLSPSERSGLPNSTDQKLITWFRSKDTAALFLTITPNVNVDAAVLVCVTTQALGDGRLHPFREVIL
jgi:hypothetical protein